MAKKRNMPTKAEITDVIETCEGDIKEAATRLGVSTMTIRQYLLRYPKLGAKFREDKAKFGKLRLDGDDIQESLEKTDGNKTKAAKSLGVSVGSLRRYIRKWEAKDA